MNVPKLGPEPTLISRKEVDALYLALQVVVDALDKLGVDYIVTGGSLLGAIRQHSLLFCDDDIDIAIIDYDGHQYEHVALNLQDFLPEGYSYQIRPWEGGDRIRPTRMSNVFVDLFTLRRYQSAQELKDVIGWKKNGKPQSNEYVQGILSTIEHASVSQGETEDVFPCWQFSTRKAVEMWPKEVYREHELFPLDKSLKFGPLVGITGPCAPVRLLQRAFGRDCFQVYYQSVSHQTASTTNSHSETSVNLPPLTTAGGTWENGAKVPLEDIHFLPMQPTARVARRATSHCRESLQKYLEEQTQADSNLSAIPLVMRKVPDRTVYMDGVFDMFHVGHLEAIRHCARLGNRVIIGVTGDQDAIGYKRKPIIEQDHRVAIVEALPEVSQVICPCPLIVSPQFMSKYGIDLVVHGFANEQDVERQKAFFAYQRKMKLFQRIPYYGGLSTTEIIGRVEQDSESPPTTLNGKPQWFGSTVRAATKSSSTIPFDPFPLPLRQAIEPLLENARNKRKTMLEGLRKGTEEERFDRILQEFHRSYTGGTFTFDAHENELRKSLLASVGLSSDFQLEHMHEEHGLKRSVLRRLTENYAHFQSVYDDFVRVHCLPHLGGMTGATDFYVQSFPCIRIVRPGEFSIGPHSDVSYGHHPCSINFYVPLTEIGGTSALYLESRPGSEDWYPIQGNYGFIQHFAGAMCLHWTTENTTSKTRVSLDFRVIDGRLFHEIVDTGEENGGKLDVYRRNPGYYNRYAVDDGVWHSDEHMNPPDFRVGFPWTVKNWEKVSF